MFHKAGVPNRVSLYGYAPHGKSLHYKAVSRLRRKSWGYSHKKNTGQNECQVTDNTFKLIHSILTFKQYFGKFSPKN